MRLPRYVDLLYTRELLSIRQGINDARALVINAAKRARLDVSTKLCWTNKITKLDTLYPGWRRRVNVMDDDNAEIVLKKLERVEHYIDSGNKVAHMLYEDDIARLSLRDPDVDDIKNLLREKKRADDASSM